MHNMKIFIYLLCAYNFYLCSGESRCKLSKEVNKFLPGTTIHRVQRKHFDDKKGYTTSFSCYLVIFV